MLTPCPSGSVPNTKLTSCVCSAYASGYDELNNKCVACASTQIIYNLVCITCPAGSSPNSLGNYCICSNTLTVFDTVTGNCISSVSNSIALNGSAISCPSSSFASGY